LLLLTLGGGSLAWWWGQGQMQAQEVEAALAEAHRQIEGQNWPKARASLERAEGRLGNRGGTLRQRVRQTQADLELVAALDEARLRREDGRGTGFNDSAADRAYTEAFRQHGIDLLEVPEAEAVAWLQQSAVREALLAALVNWASFKPGDEAGRGQLQRLLEQADHDPWRRQFRALVDRKDREALKQLARQEDTREQPPVVLQQLGSVLLHLDMPEESADLLRGAVQQYPGDFWVHFDLAWCLYHYLQPPRLEEAVAHYRVAVGLRPHSTVALNNLGIVLRDKKDLDGAIACFHKALDLDPDYLMANHNLGLTLANKKEWKEAMACFRKAIQIDPTYARSHNSLGRALYDQRDFEGAIACYRKAIELDPAFSQAHFLLGTALLDKRDVEGAIASLEKAIKLEPTLAEAYNNLGNALTVKGDWKGAITRYRQAIEVAPNVGQTHYNLADALLASKDLEGAITSYRQAIQLAPNLVWAHTHLGSALYLKKDLAGAVECYRKATQLNPRSANSHKNLTFFLLRCGRWREARDSAQSGLASISKTDPLRPALEVELTRAEAILTVEPKVPDALAGADPSRDNRERRALIWACKYRDHHAATARLSAAAFTAEPATADDLSAGLRYFAATSACLAGCSEGEDSARLRPDEKARLRAQALSWLRADLALWKTKVGSGKPADSQKLVDALQRWLAEPDLKGVRPGPERIDQPAEERAAWDAFWDEVGNTLAAARKSLNPGQR
jgi:tetratricopeptide (TPR) repeat protein